MSKNERPSVCVEEVTGFKGVTAAQGGGHLLVKLEIEADDRIFAIKASDIVPIAINLMAGGMQCQRMAGNEKPVAALLPAHECQVVLSEGRLLLNIVTTNDVGFVFDFDAERAAELSMRLSQLADLLRTIPSKNDPFQ